MDHHERDLFGLTPADAGTIFRRGIGRILITTNCNTFSTFLLMKLAELTWPDVQDLDRNILVMCPIGSLEQHSRHLPFFTDTILCDAVANRLENQLLKHILLLPIQWLGASEHHLGMNGTLTAAPDVYLRILCEPLACLLRAQFKRIFVINGHGGNIDGFHLALRQLACEFPDAVLSGASYWDWATEEIAGLLDGNLKHVGHACEFETSLMMHLRPDLVREKNISDDWKPDEENSIPGLFRPLDMKRQTPNGGTGYPSFATAKKGEALLNVIVSKGVEMLMRIPRPSPPAGNDPKTFLNDL